MKRQEPKDHIKSLLGRAKMTRDKIAALRDLLRTQVQDLEEVCRSIEEGIDEFDEGTSLLESGLDKMSSYI